jgi:hypothetical protein
MILRSSRIWGRIIIGPNLNRLREHGLRSKKKAAIKRRRKGFQPEGASYSRGPVSKDHKGMDVSRDGA